jgi:hypothetical protein
MPRRRRTLSVYAASAPIGSVSCESSSTADCASATASATVRLQDRVCLVDALLGGGGGFGFDVHDMSRAAFRDGKMRVVLNEWSMGGGRMRGGEGRGGEGMRGRDG